MTVSEAFLIVVDDILSMYSPAFPYSLYVYQTVTADLYLQAFLVGYLGIECHEKRLRNGHQDDRSSLSRGVYLIITMFS